MAQERPYQLRYSMEALKALKKMPRHEANRTRTAVERLRENPHRMDMDVRPLRGRAELRLRVGNRRVLLMRDDPARVIDVVAIGSRGDVYKRK